MSDEIRYIVLGQAAQVGEWRRERGLPRRRVIDAVRQPRLLVGLAGPLALVFLPSWGLIEWRTAMHVLAQIQPLRDRGDITTEGPTVICPNCHQTLVEVDNPVRREFRHRRGTECVPVDVPIPAPEANAEVRLIGRVATSIGTDPYSGRRYVGIWANGDDLTPDQADQLADDLRAKASTIRGRSSWERRGWFADQDPDDPDHMPSAPWRPYLQCGGVCPPLRMWFQTKGDCERFIRDEVIGKPWLDSDERSGR